MKPETFEAWQQALVNNEREVEESRSLYFQWQSKLAVLYIWNTSIPHKEEKAIGYVERLEADVRECNRLYEEWVFSVMRWNKRMVQREVERVRREKRLLVKMGL